MTDLPSSLGVEAVELVSEGARVTVRVTGRWRRRRAELRGQMMVVFDGPAGRQRFLAMPEPPSLTGAAPGTWRMSFSVPAELAPSLPGRTYLQLGGVMVPLPIGDVVVADESTEEPDPDLIEARRARSSELAAESARRRVAELAAHVEGLEHDLTEAREESERLRESIADRERRLRSSQQDAHAERALRADLEQELTRHTRAARRDLAALHERVADLERELTRMRRAVDEAGHLAAAAEAARAAAERRLAERAPPTPAPPPPSPPSSGSPPTSYRTEAIRRELALRSATPGVPQVVPQLPPEHARDGIALRQEVAMADARAARSGAGAERMAALERELAAAHEEIERQRERIGAQHEEIETQREQIGAQHEEIEVQRQEVRAQRQEIEAQRDEIDAQRRRTARAYEAIDLVRGELRQLRATGQATASPPLPGSSTSRAGPTAAGTPAPPAAGHVEPERLSEALTRLRERTPVVPSSEDADETEPEAEAAPVPEEAPAAEALKPLPAPFGRPVKPWMGKAFRALAKQDSSTAGHLLLALLPAQRAADPHPVAYDLALSDVLWAQVTVDSVTVQVQLDPTPRPLSEVDFQLVGDLAGIARLLAAGRFRRRLGRLAPGRRFARVRGDRRRLPALDRLLTAPLALRDLRAAGVELDPLLAMTLAALMIEPEWTAGERFTIGHRRPEDPSPDAYLQVRDGRAALASAIAPHGLVSTVIVCASQELMAVLGGSVAAPEIAGDQRPLSLLLQWLERAQCG
ncbi:MAG TPA: hypothetical protein VEF89_04270 [Solirubrobacteraceae bacterium]|nr:hypothetical protein [Solirubrobacteraceae bacterium]